MAQEVNITQWIENFKKGEYSNTDFSTQCKAGWYDWFCKDSSLAGKTRALGVKLMQISKSPKINCETSYVWFKNNCPCNGSLYDDFRIADMETGDVIFTIVPKSGYRSMNGLGEVWGKENGFKEALMTGTWGEIKNWFLK